MCEGVSWIHLADDRVVGGHEPGNEHSTRTGSGRSDREGTEQPNCAMCSQFTVCFLKYRTWYSDHLSNIIKTASWVKVNSSLSTPWGHLGERRGRSPLIFTSALDGGEWTTSRPGRCTPGQETWYPLNM